jgi:hypothetical protein
MTGIANMVSLYCSDGNLRLIKKHYFANLTLFQNNNNKIWEYMFYRAYISENPNITKWILKIKPDLNHLHIYHAFKTFNDFNQKKVKLQLQGLWYFYHHKTKELSYKIYTKKQQIAKQM